MAAEKKTNCFTANDMKITLIYALSSISRSYRSQAEQFSNFRARYVMYSIPLQCPDQLQHSTLENRDKYVDIPPQYKTCNILTIPNKNWFITEQGVKEIHIIASLLPCAVVQLPWLNGQHLWVWYSDPLQPFEDVVEANIACTRKADRQNQCGKYMMRKIQALILCTICQRIMTLNRAESIIQGDGPLNRRSHIWVTQTSRSLRPVPASTGAYGSVSCVLQEFAKWSGDKIFQCTPNQAGI